MSEFRVFVPPGMEEEVKTALAGLKGVHIVKGVKKNLDEYQDQLEQKREQHRRVVASLTELKDPETEARIIEGYKTLLVDLYGEKPNKDRPAASVMRFNLDTDEAVLRLKTTFVSIAQECLERPPRYYSFPTGDVIEPIWDRDIIRPRGMQVLIKVYGLVDGNPQSHKEVGHNLGMNQQRVGEIQRHAEVVLRYPTHKRKLARFFSQHPIKSRPFG